MIAYIKGTVDHISDQTVVLENQGIGYIISAAPATLGRLPRNEEVQIHTYMQVKEDGMSLFGFLNQEELQLFRLLISISGIGPKVGMAILGIMSPSQIMVAIVNQDAVAFSKVPGVGKKTAQRITLELQDKIKTQDLGLKQEGMNMGAVASSEKQDAIDALLALGYSRSESVRAVLAAAEEDMPTEQIIRMALKKLV